MDATIPKPSGPSYGELAAKMREKPTFTAAEDTIKKDYPLKLPSRRFIQLWNTPEITQFRGYQRTLTLQRRILSNTQGNASKSDRLPERVAAAFRRWRWYTKC